MAIDTPNKDYMQMLERWRLPLTLDDGIFSLKNKKVARDWLPQLPKESDEAYELRLQRSGLFNVYKRTITSLVGTAFSKNVTVTGLPEELSYLEYNVNGEGQSITELAAQLFMDTLNMGKSHVYPDFPRLDTDGMSYAEFRELGAKPYIARIDPRNVIGWKHTYDNGFERLDYVRIKETREEEDEETYEQFERHIIRKVSKDFIEVWETNSNDTGVGFELVDSYENTLGEVPLLCAYSNKVSPFKAYPVLEDLAWLNLTHYQSSSDQRNILHIARVPFLLAAGFTESEVDTMDVAANRMVITSNKDATIKYIEHTGAAINAGRMDAKDLEEQMSRAGAEILFSKSVARQTAQGRKIDQAEALSTIQVVLRSIEQMLEQALIFCGKWLELDDFDPSVTIGASLDVAEDPNPVQSFALLQEITGMTGEQALEELKRRGLLAPHIQLSDLDFKEREEEEPEADENNEPENTNTDDEVLDNEQQPE